MQFHTIRAGARPLFAIAASPGHPLAASVRCYPAHTWKKKFVKSAALAAARAGILPSLFPAADLPMREPAAGETGPWLENLREHIASGPLHPVWVWPGDPARGRLYLHLLDAHDTPVAFGKLALDHENAAGIRTEIQTLNDLGSLPITTCRIPQVIATEPLAGMDAIVVSRAPENARATRWAHDPPIHDIVHEYAGEPRTISAPDARRLPWWKAIEALAESQPVFATAIREAAAHDIRVCRIHGDLNQTNVLRANGEVWLLDWEQSQPDGPALTDPVCMAVDQAFGRFPRDANRQLEHFRERFLTGVDETGRREAILALAYLGAVRFTPAGAIISAWKPD